MNKNIVILILVACLTIGGMAHGQKYSQGGSDRVGVALTTCSEFLAAISTNPILEKAGFLTGRRRTMTGANVISELAGRVSKNLSARWMGDQILRIHNYCLRHPSEAYVTAVAELYVALPLNPIGG